MSCERPNEANPPKPLISRSSILILGGILVGVTWSEAFGGTPSGPKFYAFLAALVAFIAFLALDLVGQQRRLRAERQAHQAAMARLEQRVTRHLTEDPIASACPRAPAKAASVR
jgi:hypothetical protein